VREEKQEVCLHSQGRGRRDYTRQSRVCEAEKDFKKEIKEEFFFGNGPRRSIQKERIGNAGGKKKHS